MYVFFLAIAAGFLTILAPCILPILPFLLATSGGRSRYRPVAIIGGFVLAFSVLGAALATAGTVFGISNQTLRYVAATLLLLFGLALLFDETYRKLVAKTQAAFAGAGMKLSGGAATKTDALSGVALGASLAIIWAPCAGPVLGLILTLASREKDFLGTMLLMFAYALGAGVPMLGIAYGGGAIKERLRRAGRHVTALNRIFGVIVIAGAVAVFTGTDVALQTWLLVSFPSFRLPL